MATRLAQIIADFSTSLATAISIGGTTATLQSATDDDGNALPSGTYYFAIDGNNSSKEHIQATLSGTSLTAIKTVSRQGVMTSGVARAHRVGATVTLTDFAHIKLINDTLKGSETLDGTAPLKYDASFTPTIGQFMLATWDYIKFYVDGVAVAGAPNASTTIKGIVQEATQAQVLAKTASGSTGADLYVNPSTLPSTLLSDYKADTGAADAYVITPSPAITAYTTGQRFSFKVSANNATTTPTLNVNALGAKTITKLGGIALVVGDLINGQIVEVEYDGTNFQLLSPTAKASLITTDLKFGGTGTDGALSISSGVTTIDCANANIVIKNYTSISITGTASLAFINPASDGTIVIIRSQGNVTVTSSTNPAIDLSGMGAVGGTAGSSPDGAGTNGTNAFSILDDTNTHGGNTGSARSGTTGGNGGASGTAYSNVFLYTRKAIDTHRKGVFIAPGSGGGGGAAGFNSNGGAGGRGGGGLIIECKGALNLTSNIKCDGNAGTAGVDFSSANFNISSGGGGGGGAGGFAVILYNTLTANSGTISCNGGAGAKGGNAQLTATTASGTVVGGGGGGSGAGADGGAGGAGGTGGSDSTGSGGSAGAGRRAGGGGSGGASMANNGGAHTNTSPAGGAGGGTENVLVAQNLYLA